MNRLLIACCCLLPALASVTHADDELRTVVQGEQKAFEEGDCDKVISLMSEDITFYANSRKMSRAQVDKFCRSIPRPFGAGKAPISDTLTPYRVGENLGYTVRDFRWEDKNNRVIHEIVTKIWRKSDTGWSMVHFQSTVVPEQ